MGLFDWLKGLFGKGPAKRKIAALGGEDEDLDEVLESIDLGGGPLVEHHRRRALRDRRLLPKKRPLLRGKRKRVMSAFEARRLFGATLRTRNRKLRDLLPDEEQLARHDLPLYRTEAELAEALGLTERQLRHYAIHRKAEPVLHYVSFAVPKRTGGERVIMAPKRRLKALQRRLNDLVVRKLPVSEHAHGFLPKRSIKTGAEHHARKRVVVKMDLADFFPSITFARVRGLFVAMGYGYPVATALAVLMTEAERQPVQLEERRVHVPIGQRYAVQGAPTSPGLANAITLKLDRRLAGLARKLGFAYTRYADDLAFSGDDPAKIARLIRHVTAIVEDEGFRVNTAKTRVMRRGGRQVVTGVTVNDQLGASRRERKKLRALIHQHGDDPERAAEIRGKLAFVHMLNPEQAARLRAAPRRRR